MSDRKALERYARQPPYTPGPSGRALLQAAADAGTAGIEPEKASGRQSCLKLHDRGLLDRDPQRANRFFINEGGRAAIAQFKAGGA